MPRGGLGQGPPVFTTKERTKLRCAGVLCAAVHLRHTVGPKSLAAPKCPGAGTAAIRGSVWTCQDERSSCSSGYNSQSAVTARRIHQANLLGEEVENGQTSGDQGIPPDGFQAHRFQLRTIVASHVCQHEPSPETQSWLLMALNSKHPHQHSHHRQKAKKRMIMEAENRHRDRHRYGTTRRLTIRF